MDWVRQPIRLSQQDVSPRAIAYQAPIEVAELTPLGHSALDWLATLEQTPWWESVRARPYRTHSTRGHT